VLHRFKLLLKRFQRDERGAFLVLFGVMALVLIATSGAVVDYTQIEQARSRAQNALDAAALGLQPHVFDEPAKNKEWFITEAKALLAERLAADTGVTSTINDATFDKTNGQLILKAEITVSTSFVSLVGVPSITASLISEATRKRLNIEVAMVLDNSGSMLSYQRMVKLKEAAKSATDILFDYEATQPNVFISIVPFTQYVNVGTANRTASWMSQTGASSISHLNFDDDDDESTPFTGTVNRWSLYDGFSNESWAGCVEARVAPYDADDTVPNNAVADTMFQPVFAPDMADNQYYDSYVSDSPAACQKTRACKQEQTYSSCDKWGNNCYGYSNTYTATYPNGTVTTGSSACSCAGETTSSSTGSVYKISNGNYGKVTTSLCTDHYVPSGLSTVELAQRLCKYSGASFSGSGPNSDCPSTPILPLNNVRDTVKARIDAMVASGSTNIEQGSIWGFHSLSPTQPLIEGKSYDEATSKIMIVMTDGENNINYDSYWNTTYGVSSYMAWGYRSNKRLLTESTSPKDSAATSAQVIAEVNRRTVLACTNAKAKGIKVYTIGLSVPNATTKTMLQNCASPTETINGETIVYSHFPTNSADLVTVFETIAGQLSELRLAQ
jgi:Flp pilus assembly protein TadG